MDRNNPQLEKYYSDYFPGEEMAKFVATGDKKDKLKLREVSFTMGSIYIRYQSFFTYEQFIEKVKSRYPDKIDFGAFFNHPAKNRNKVDNFCAKEKEFVVDIDITDYDNVRTDFCGCKDASYCEKCWGLMNCAIEILNYMFEKFLSCSKYIWIYSGRRGIHCWVKDESLLKLDTMGRSAVAEFFNVYTGGNENIRSTCFEKGKIHPDFLPSSKIYKIAEKYFLEVVCGNFELFEEDNIENFMKFFENTSDNLKLKAIKCLKKNKSKSNEEKWRLLKNVFSNQGAKKLAIEIVYSFCFPRLDINVSRHLNHLLKAPFCVHPKSGYVCVPINKNQYSNFYPGKDSPSMKGLIEDNKEDLEKFKLGIEALKEYNKM